MHAVGEFIETKLREENINSGVSFKRLHGSAKGLHKEISQRKRPGEGKRARSRQKRDPPGKRKLDKDSLTKRTCKIFKRRKIRK